MCTAGAKTRAQHELGADAAGDRLKLQVAGANLPQSLALFYSTLQTASCSAGCMPEERVNVERAAPNAVGGIAQIDIAKL